MVDLDETGPTNMMIVSTDSVSSPSIEGGDAVGVSTNDPSIRVGSTTIMAEGDRERMSGSLSPKDAAQVPLVELSLQNITYAPTTTRVGYTLSGSKKQSGSKTQTSHQRTQVLKGVSTTISPFQLTAWIGPSGSGKTSLISVAARLIKQDDLMEGSAILVNGEEGRMPKRLVGVVWQDDLLLSNLTVYENIYFAARLKTPQRDATDERVHQVVEATMRELGLWGVKNSLVGGSGGMPGSSAAGRGISGGERKRVSVAVELVVRPSLLLLDEPTSGLDATTAQSLVQTLKDLASRGHSVAMVVHQPRTTIFNMLDHLLLLSKGRVLYNGDPTKVRGYLEASQCPAVTCLPPETGIADWIMDSILADERLQAKQVIQEKGQEDDAAPLRTLAQNWSDCVQKGISFGCARTEHEAKNIPQVLSHQLSSLEELQSVPKFNSSFWTQFTLLTARTMKQQRGERLTATALVLQLLYLLFTALFWWRLPNRTGRIFERNSLLFFMIIAQSNGIIISAVTVFQTERALLFRERAKKMYGVGSYFLAKTVSDMTNNVLFPLLYIMVVYWTANFRVSATAYFKYILAFYCTLSTAQSMGLWVSIAIPNKQLALVLAPPLTLFFIIVGGFYVPLQSMPPAVAWTSWLSFARYGYSALIINEFQGQYIPCDEGSDDAAIQVGHSDGTGSVCPLPGDDVVDSMIGSDGIAENYWFNVVMVMVLQVAFRLSSYIILRRSK